MSVENGITVRDLVERLGRAEIMAAGSISTQQITNWIRDDRIPPARYPIFRDLCVARGMLPPDSLFFERARKTPVGTSTETLTAGSPTGG